MDELDTALVSAPPGPVIAGGTDNPKGYAEQGEEELPVEEDAEDEDYTQNDDQKGVAATPRAKSQAKARAKPKISSKAKAKAKAKASAKAKQGAKSKAVPKPKPKPKGQRNENQQEAPKKNEDLREKAKQSMEGASGWYLGCIGNVWP